MTKITSLSLTLLFLFICSCHSGDDKEKTKRFPKPGTLMASAEMPVTDDQLNHFMFSVKVIADSNVRSGVYDVDADYGPNFAEGQFTMPTGIEDAKPVIKKGKEPYTYIIGFQLPNDTTFYEYFQIQSDRKTTKMQYIKAYTF